MRASLCKMSDRNLNEFNKQRKLGSLLQVMFDARGEVASNQEGILASRTTAEPPRVKAVL